MNRIKIAGRLLRPIVGVAAALTFGTAFAANPGTGTTGTGQALNIQIDAPLAGASVTRGDIAVRGRAAIGPLAIRAAVIYTLDVSGSTDSPKGMDCNADGVSDSRDDINGKDSVGTTLDCEVNGVLALNRTLIDSGDTVAGVVSFANDAANIDVNPSVAGTQLFAAPGIDVDRNGVRDVEGAVLSLRSNGLTNFDAALTRANTAFATRPAGERRVNYFLSDGRPTAGQFTTGAGSPLSVAVAAGTRIETYSIGVDGAGCATNSPLRIISDATGGQCTVVLDPTRLTGVLSGTVPAGLSQVVLSVGGGATRPAVLDPLGNFVGMVPVTALGAQTVAAKVIATDGTPATATVTVTAVPDNSPDPFAFVDRTGVPLSVLVESAPITVSGIDAATAISVSGGEYSVNGGPFTSAPGNVVAGAKVRARVLSSATELATTSAVVTIGDRSDSFDVRTLVKIATDLDATATVALLNPGQLLGVSLRMTATLRDANGVPLANQTVVFKTALNAGCTATTGADGVARCSLTLQRLLGTVLGLGFTAEYAGSPTYRPATDRGVLVRALTIGVL